jgi:hypothetical protein
MMMHGFTNFKCLQGFGGETEGKRPPGSLGLCRMIILKRIIKKSDGRTNRLD